MSFINISPVAKFLGLGKYQMMSLEDGVLYLLDADTSTDIILDKIETFNMSNGTIWNSFEITLTNENSYTAGGFSKAQAAEFYSYFEKAFAEQYYSRQHKKAQKVLRLIPSGDQYFQTKLFNDLISAAKREMKGFKFLPELEDSRYSQALSTILELLDGRSRLQENHNNNFLKAELIKYIFISELDRYRVEKLCNFVDMRGKK